MVTEKCRNEHRRDICVTCAESVDVLVKLKAHDRAVVVNDVGLAVPGARHHLLPAVPLHADAHVQTQSWGEIREGEKVTETGQETKKTSTYRDVELLQGKELMIHLHGPEQLLRAVHQLQRPCRTSQTDGS